MNRLSATNPVEQPPNEESVQDVTDLTDAVIPPVSGVIPSAADSVFSEIVEQSCLDKVILEVCLATGATGAAIALALGADMVCCATSGADAPDLGAHLNPRTGLSGCCMQTRQVQQCRDTETDSRVDAEACRRLGVRSIVVLPLMESDELFGIFEILSSQPDAFGKGHLDCLRILANRIVKNRQERREALATPPQKNLPLDPARAEQVARDAFMESVQREAKPRLRNVWMAARTVAIIALAVLLGWLLGRAAWKIAVDRADSEISKPQEETQAASQVDPDTVSASTTIEKAQPTSSEIPPLPESATAAFEGNAMQYSAAQDTAPQASGISSAPTEISSKSTGNYVLKKVKPAYPEDAKQQHIQGRVVMKILVGTDGLVRDLVVMSGDDSKLVNSALKAVRQWRFKPHRINGQPIEFETQITVNFALS